MATSVADTPRGHSTDSDVQDILLADSGDHHEAYAHNLLDAAAPHKRATLNSGFLGKINVDLVKEGKQLCSVEGF